MPLRECVPLLKFVGTLATPIMYIVAFGSGSWITAGNHTFGLWSWCYNNFTDEDDITDFVNDSSRCHGIDPGESPAYYEATRVLACFTLVVFIGFFFTFNDREGLGKEKKPMIVAVAACSMCGITVSVMGDNYGDDERWKTSGAYLNWCYWLAMSTGIISFLMVFIMYENAQMKKKAACTAVVPSVNAPARAANRNNTGSASNAGSSTSSGASAPIPGKSQAASATTNSYNQFPILEPPRYEVLREPGGIPMSPPPSYEDAIGSDSAYGPAPRAYIA